MKKTYHEFQIRLNQEIYNVDSYEDFSLWMDYWYQLESLRETKPKSVLEIGKGTGTLEFMMKSRGYKYKTLDIDPRLSPDYVGDAAELPFKDDSFDTVCAFQVLEHIPFSEFNQVISEMRRVAKNYVVLSLPYSCFYFSFAFQIFYARILDPFFKLLKMKPSLPVYLNIKIPTFFLKKYGMHETHEWEIGRKGMPLSFIRNIFKDNKLDVIKESDRIFYPYHLFFILKKI